MLKLGGGIALLMVSAFMGIGFLAGGASSHSIGIQILAVLVSVGIPGAGGVALVREHLRSHRALPQAPEVPMLPRARWGSELIKLATKKGGRLTVVEVVAETTLTPEEAQAALDEACTAGHAEPEVTEGGLIVYAFRDVLLLAEKSASRGLLES